MSIDSNRLIAEIRILAEERPKYVYQKPGQFCMYTDNAEHTGCGCIVGQALLRIEPKLYPLLEQIDKNVSVVVSQFNAIAPMLEITDTRKVNWINAVQDYQDTGYDWSTAVARADRYFSLV